MKKYDPKKIETKWQKHWASKKVFVANDKSKLEKKFVLVEFPFPSGSSLHMGHLRPYTAGDIVSKYHKMNGKNVMYPIGWDAFGLPAENFAIKNKVHPEISTKKNVASAKKQLQNWGIGFDWSREINTTDPKYYKWTQKIFLEFLKAGLAYEKTGLINWCPVDKTGLANEEVIDGKCERCGTEVVKREMKQWYLKITDYAEKLLDGLKHLPEWPEAIKLQQENWIGKSEGAEIDFKIKDLDSKIKVFTTRPDTIYGATYLVLAPEHPLISELKIENKKEVENYIENTKNKSDIDRTSEGKEKTGIEIKGAKAINSANNKEIPVWIADYVLGSYGTGAIMAVPAHDERDFAFAKKFNLEIKEVVIKLIGKPLSNLNRRDVVKAVVIKNGMVLLVKEDGYYTLPGGTYDKGETDNQTVIREVSEETGYQNSVVKKYLGAIESIWKESDQNKARRVSAYTVEVDENQKIEAHDEHITSVEWLPINEGVELIKKGNTKSEHEFILRAQNNSDILFSEEGILINSEKFDGLSSDDAKKKITDFVGGKMVTKYKLRDWVFSRQRYWGEPIPVIHCDKCGVVPVPEKDLPVLLPKVKNYEPTGTGESPLAGIEKWVNTKCPKCEAKKNETKYLIFDFDGVIGDTYKANLQARVAVGWAKDIEDSKRVSFEYFSRRPHHAKGHTMTTKEIRTMLDKCKIFGESINQSGFKIFTDFVNEIKKLKKVKIAFISSGSNVYVHDAIKKTKLNHDGILTIEDSLSKEDKLESFAKKWKTDIKNIYYFTDANADVYELESLMDRKKIIGCSWGYLGEEELLKALPANQILKTPKDIHKVFESGIAKRETNTMPQWAGSSWYWLRYCDPKNTKEFADIKKIKYWTPVDLYFGGMEHTTLHLLYSRFWNQFLFDRGLVTTSEPYIKRVPHGIILGPDGEKMSKSKGNVVNPDDVAKVYGVDTMRLYMAFLGPHCNQVAWNDKGIIGTRRFIERVFAISEFISKEEPKKVTTVINKTIKKVQEDIQNTAFNTAVSALMICVNTIHEHKKITKKSFEKLLQILAPLAPHISEELWSNLGNKKSIFLSKWPIVDEKSLIEDVSISIQINGKAREVIVLAKDTPENEMLEKAKNFGSIPERLIGKEIVKTIAVKNRVVNFVIKE
ncbi:MAG: class I tRNA ligase family protein [bacterium]